MDAWFVWVYDGKTGFRVSEKLIEPKGAKYLLRVVRIAIRLEVSIVLPCGLTILAANGCRTWILSGILHPPQSKRQHFLTEQLHTNRDYTIEKAQSHRQILKYQTQPSLPSFTSQRFPEKQSRRKIQTGKFEIHRSAALLPSSARTHASTDHHHHHHR